MIDISKYIVIKKTNDYLYLIPIDSSDYSMYKVSPIGICETNMLSGDVINMKQGVDTSEYLELQSTEEFLDSEWQEFVKGKIFNIASDTHLTDIITGETTSLLTDYFGNSYVVSEGKRRKLSYYAKPTLTKIEYQGYYFTDPKYFIESMSVTGDLEEDEAIMDIIKSHWDSFIKDTEQEVARTL